MEPSPAARSRVDMVERQLRTRGVTDVRVLDAMRTVPREKFVPPGHAARAYADCALPIGQGQTISQPFMVALTCALARLAGHEHVLEVGAGSGYQAAVLGALARRVISLERIPDLADIARRNLEAAGTGNVEVVVGDGTLGYPSEAPYDAIVVAAGAPRIPAPLVDQLAPGGRLVIPLGSRDIQELTVVEKTPGGLVTVGGTHCVFVPLIGAAGWDGGPGAPV